jgi:hypothetical protein
MQITCTVADEVLTATLNGSAAAHDFVGLLPLTLTLNDFHQTEKVADLPSRLSTSGSPSAAAAKSGDLTYYAPWGNLAIFYRDFRRSEGLVSLGSFDGSIRALTDPRGPVEVRFDVMGR